MFGKGLKRKLEEDEARLEGKALEVACPEALSKVSYTLQRQTIFNISLLKLYTPRPSEPSLRRRVLINNMLRRIQDELRQDGSSRPLLLPPSPPPDDPLDEGYRQAPPTFGATPTFGAPPLTPHPLGSGASLPALVMPQDCPLEVCLTPASLLEDDHMENMENATFSLSAPPTPPASPRPLPKPSDSSPPPPPPPSRTAVPPHPHAALTVSTSQLSREHRVKPDLAGVLLLDTLPTDSAPSPSDSAPSPSGFLSDLALDDVLFADIDTSMYDFDPCTAAHTAGSAVMATAAGGISKLGPAVTADDLIKSLASPYTGPAPQVSSNQPFKIDLTELDHIMEVLVGS
ncbi:unnamed protein product [Knipowitschia caucasica]|uniref:SERTA domain-containing protein n=1 Tax=Knipowitschia caucasica TaxID=637954 RepID=A0AAV2JHU0_KNICA